MHFVKKKSHIPETENLSSDGDSSTNTQKILLGKSCQKKNLFCAAFLHPLWAKFLQIWYHFFQFIFPKNSKILKSFDIGFWKVGAKRRWNRVNKWNIHKKKTFFLPQQFTPFKSLFLLFFFTETISFHYFSPRIPRI